MLPLRSIPGPSTVPIFGNLHLYKLGVLKVERYHEVLVSLYEKYGSIVRTQHGPFDTIIHLFDPEDAEFVLNREGKMPYVKPLQETVQHYRKINDASPGLGNTNGEEWYRMRSAVRQILLRPVEVKSFLPTVNKITNEFVDRLKRQRRNDNIVDELRMELSKWSRERNICFGFRLGSMDGGKNEEVAEAIIKANRLVFKLNTALKFSLPFYRYFKTPKWRKLAMAEDVLSHNGATLVNEVLQNLQTNQAMDCRIMEYLLSRPELSKKDISTIILSLLTDGLSTTVPTLMCSLYCLASHLSIQDELFHEVSEVTKGNDVLVEHLAKSPLLKAFVKEVFRMYPNGIGVDRILQSDHTISGYHLGAGTNVTMNQFVHFRSEKYFDNPNKFMPHRWLRGDSAPSIHKFLLIPFGFGARSCIGRRFAEQDIYVVLSKILLNFQVKLVKDIPLVMEYETLLSPREPLQLQFIDR